MVRAEYVPAVGEQFNSVWNRGLIYKGKNNKEYDMKFFTDKSHFNYNFGLQSCYYGLYGIGRNAITNYRDMIQWPKDKMLITDSGGFQIASFKKRGEVCKLDPLTSLRWQEDNADVAMNLDVPPTLGDVPTYGEFNEALKVSVDNFRLFEKERKNYKMRLLNVLHGETIKHMDIWYRAVKDFNFDGWAIGMKPPWDNMIQAMGFLYLYEKGEFDKQSFKHLHFFGTSGKHVCPTIAYAAHKLKGINVTYDSSSYNIGSIYRTYYQPFDLGPHLSFGDKFKEKNPHLKELPCMCPVCQSISDINDLNKTDIYAGTLLSLHNMWQYIQYNQILNSLVIHKDHFIEYLKTIGISDKALISLDFIDYAIDNGLENATKKFESALIPQRIDVTKQVSVFNF